MTPAFSADDHRHMARALELAARGLYSTAPNPRVGCVLVRDGVVVGEGFHARAGEPHAEVHALAAAGERARGATAYVTLEPCAHHGRTPPCADALVRAGVARVVYAIDDPFPQVDGRGAARLAAAGIAVERGCQADAALELNLGFVMRLRRGRPWTRLKLAASLDGRTALADGTSRWITGDAARADVQRLRARSGAVLAGAASVVRDDARLDVRDPALERRGRPVLRVVLDPRLVLEPGARLFASAGPVLVLTTATALAARGAALRGTGAELVAVPAAPGGLALAAVLDELARRAVNELLLEVGPRLAGAWLQARLVDELVLYVAPRLLGDAALPLARLPPLESLTGTPGWRYRDVRQVGGDLRLTLRPQAEEG